MKHEKFKVFTSEDETNEFLKESHIVPKSISVIDDENVAAIVIGYVEDKKKKHSYEIGAQMIEQVYFIGLEKAMEQVEKSAEELGGVVCQDVRIFEGDLIVTFLIEEELQKDKD